MSNTKMIYDDDQSIGVDVESFIVSTIKTELGL